MEEIIYMIKNGYRFIVESNTIKIKMLNSCLKDNSIKEAFSVIKINKKTSIEFLNNHIKEVEFCLEQNNLDNINAIIQGVDGFIETIAIDINRERRQVKAIILTKNTEIFDEKEIRINAFWNNPFMDEATKKIKEKLKIS